MHKILIITYYWPPAGGPGVQRWLKFVKYLPGFGVEPVVYLPENPNYAIRDESLLGEIPGGITYIHKKIREPYRWAAFLAPKKTRRISSGIIRSTEQTWTENLLLWVRGNFFIPDARNSWVQPSIKYLKEYLIKSEITMIVTTGPPHSMHLIGMGLKSELPIKWVADFRDPWTSIGYHKKLKLTSASRRKHMALEKMVLNTADKIIVTSQTTRKEFQALTPKPVCVITNGFDEMEAFFPPLDTKFTISHIGSMLTGRNPENLWQALSELISEQKGFREELRLQFIGVLSDDILKSIISKGLQAHITEKGYISHSEAVRYQRSSQVLLLVEMDAPETRGIIPGKLFEYLAAMRPVLAIGPVEWEAGEMVKHAAAGAVFDYQSIPALKKVLLSWFQQFQKGKLKLEEGRVVPYSRKSLTQKLVGELPWE